MWLPPVVTESYGRHGIPNNRGAYARLIEDILVRAGITDGEFTLHVGAAGKGNAQRGKAGVILRPQSEDACSISMYIQPGNNNTTREGSMLPCENMSLEQLRDALVRGLDQQIEVEEMEDTNVVAVAGNEEFAWAAKLESNDLPTMLSAIKSAYNTSGTLAGRVSAFKLEAVVAKWLKEHREQFKGFRNKPSARSFISFLLACNLIVREEKTDWAVPYRLTEGGEVSVEQFRTSKGVPETAVPVPSSSQAEEVSEPVAIIPGSTDQDTVQLLALKRNIAELEASAANLRTVIEADCIAEEEAKQLLHDCQQDRESHERQLTDLLSRMDNYKAVLNEVNTLIRTALESE